MGSKRGDINGYVCDTCKQHTFIVHVDDGVTPMFLACRAEGEDPREAECKGRGTSLMYPTMPAPQHVIDGVKWEWYKPAELPENEEMAEHVRKGGLLLRKLTDAGRAALA